METKAKLRTYNGHDIAECENGTTIFYKHSNRIRGFIAPVKAENEIKGYKILVKHCREVTKGLIMLRLEDETEDQVYNRALEYTTACATIIGY